jgi:hypothetical protein
MGVAWQTLAAFFVLLISNCSWLSYFTLHSLPRCLMGMIQGMLTSNRGGPKCSIKIVHQAVLAAAVAAASDK